MFINRSRYDPDDVESSLSILRWSLVVFGLLGFFVSTTFAQDNSAQSDQTVEGVDTGDEEAPSTPTDVEVEPLAEDYEIEQRLTRILQATERFTDPEVQVEEGVAFLKGSTTKEEFREWAGDLARKTQDVVAVVNRIQVNEGSIWDLSPAWTELRTMARETVQASPLIVLAIVLLILTWFASKLAVHIAGWLFEDRITNRLLRQVATRAVAIPVFLLGLYLVLRVSGLTQMAATVLGGTGLIGLIVGIAFRDIAENFLASVLISIQRPFSIGDLIEIDGQRGYVQSVTTRGTLIMTFDGNHVQLPNSLVYKAVIHNFTANPFIRLHCMVGIGYDDSIAEAQETALTVLKNHPVILDDPEPLVLVDELGAATVNLHLYFWINVHEHSQLKANSSVVRLIKRAFEKTGISMPDEAREVVFPHGVPIEMIEPSTTAKMKESGKMGAAESAGDRDDEITSPAEGNLASEATEINEQAQQSRSPDAGDNLLMDQQGETKGDQVH